MRDKRMEPRCNYCGDAVQHSSPGTWSCRGCGGYGMTDREITYTCSVCNQREDECQCVDHDPSKCPDQTNCALCERIFNDITEKRSGIDYNAGRK